MCSAISYLFPLLIASASAQQWQYNPYMNFQNFQNFQNTQDLGQDQQACVRPPSRLMMGNDTVYDGTDSKTNVPYVPNKFQATDYTGGHDFGGYEEDGGHDFGGHGGQDFKAHSYPVHQHIHEENPEPIKHYKEVVVPVHKNVEFKINQPVLIPVPHPVPIQIPVPKAVVIPVIKEVSIPVEKSVPYPVQKEVRVPKIKEVPFEVVKHIIVPVEKPFPFKVPVYETIVHTKKGSHKI